MMKSAGNRNYIDAMIIKSLFSLDGGPNYNLAIKNTSGSSCKYTINFYMRNNMSYDNQYQ